MKPRLIALTAIVALIGCSQRTHPQSVSSRPTDDASVQPPKSRPAEYRGAGRYARAPSLEPGEPSAAAYFRYVQRLSEDGTFPDNALMIAKRQRDAMIAEQQGPLADFDNYFARWTAIGPGNIGGRIRSILIHPDQPQIMWIGSASGGIWKTLDAGDSWAPLDDFMPSLSIGSMAMDPADPDVLYAGTGEGFYDTVEGSSNLAAVRGAGIFKSIDGGDTWDQLPSTGNPDWYFVNRIAISPDDSRVLLAATQTGVYRSTDAGDSWTRVIDQLAFDVKFHPTDGAKAIAGGHRGNAHFSLDNGASWEQAAGINGERVELEYWVGGPDTVYAAVASGQGRYGTLRVYRSEDGGQTFELRTGGSGVNTLRNYTGVIWADPANRDRIIIGGQRLFRSSNGGVTFSGAFSTVHSDNHIIVEHPDFDGGDNRTIFIGTDGGPYLAPDHISNTAIARSNELAITQFYGAAINAANGVVLGGTQDNGTLVYTGDSERWRRMFGGDGGYAASDPTDPDYYYGEVQRARIFRSTNGGRNGSYIYNSSQQHPLADAGTLNVNFIPYFLLDPNEPNRMLVTARRLWRTNNLKDPAPEWFAIKASIGPGPGPGPDPDPPNDHFFQDSPWNISTVTVARGDPDLIWVGYNNGQVWKTLNGTAELPTWERLDPNGATLPGRWVSRIVLDVNDNSRVYVSYMGWEPDNVWRSENAGATWVQITGQGSGKLPSAPASALAVHRTQPGWVFVGTDIGIFASHNDGQTWMTSTIGPGTVPVEELIWRDDKTVMAVTHGRGIFLGDVGPFAGDTNCDGELSLLDIESFVLALSDPDLYRERFPDCNVNLADTNADGSVDLLDIESFLDLLLE